MARPEAVDIEVVGTGLIAADGARAQCASRALVGMASIDTIATSFGGRALTALYTSHVLILEEFRGLNLIRRVGLRSFLAERLRHPWWPIYWFFDSFSYKSYLLLPKNFRDFWPRFDGPMPEPVAALIDHLASRIYGTDWQPASGLVAASGRKRLFRRATGWWLQHGLSPARFSGG